MSRSEITAESMPDESDDGDGTTRRTYLMRRAGIVLVVLLVAVAIWALATRDSGGDSDSGTPSTTKVTPSTQVTAKMPSSKVLDADAQFATFNQLVDVAKVDLSGKDVTILAPSTKAFEALGEGDVATILNDKERAATTLKRHVLEQRLTIAELGELDGKSVKNLAGEDLPVKMTDGAVYVGGAKIAKSDIDTADAEIHVLDTVIKAP
jgi:transforming growth factor-beta-induced protein